MPPLTVSGAKVLRVYSRQGCHLCDELIEGLLPLVRGKLDVEIADIDSREDWRAEYDARVPVVEFRGRTLCEFTLDRNVIQEILDASAAS